MKKFRKVLALTLCAAALVGASVMGTMAYLTDNDEVTNTFTVGNVDITLDEAKVDEYGKEITDDGAERVDKNAYHLLPGGEYDKDPTVTVEAGSEDAYVRMMVTVSDISKLKNAFPQNDSEGNEIAANAKYYAGDVFLLQQLVKGWDNNVWTSTNEVTVDQEDSNKVTYEFRYKEAVDKSTSDTKLEPLFTTIEIPGTLNNAEIAKLNKVTITVTAHAIQADGFDTAEEAWGTFTDENPWDDTPYEPTTTGGEGEENL